jgi:hypothetical protein
MREIELAKKELPGYCPNRITSSGNGCGVSFRNYEHLFQDTDGVVYCANCGHTLGAFPLKKIPFRRLGLYDLQKANC